MSKVTLTISGHHTMEYVATKIADYESAIERVLDESGFPELVTTGSVGRARAGSGFIGDKEVFVTDSPDEQNRVVYLIVQPKGLGNGKCVLCLLDIPEPIKPIDVFKKIMQLKQPRRYESLMAVRHATAKSVQVTVKEFDEKDWVLKSVRFQIDPGLIIDDEATLLLALDEIRKNLPDPIQCRLNEQDILAIICLNCGYDAQCYDEEINSVVFHWLAESVLNKLVTEEFLVITEEEDNWYALSDKSKEILHDFDLNTAFNHSLMEQVTARKLAIEKEIALCDEEIQLNDAEIIKLQEEVQLVEQRNFSLLGDRGILEGKIKHVQVAENLIHQAIEELLLT